MPHPSLTVPNLRYEIEQRLETLPLTISESRGRQIGWRCTTVMCSPSQAYVTIIMVRETGYPQHGEGLSARFNLSPGQVLSAAMVAERLIEKFRGKIEKMREERV